MQPKLIQGDCLEVLPTLPADHFHCVVTSPPYFALRSYLPKDHPLKAQEIGSEPTPEAFIETMVRVFWEVRRVLHPSGLLFLNLGDSYDAEGRVGHGTRDGHKQESNRGSVLATDNPRPQTPHKGQLLNMPHRVAEALRADGWIWRQTIVWAKKSPMPESCKGWRWERCRVKVEGQKQQMDSASHGTLGDGDGHPGRISPDYLAKWSPCPGCLKCEPHGGYVLRKGKGRCTTAHEFVFVLSKSSLYFWNSAAFVEEGVVPSGTRRTIGKPKSTLDRAGASGRKASGNEARGECFARGFRNPRSVWLLSSEPTSVSHFATYPSELVRRCVQAGTSDGGCCPECGEPWAPVVEDQERVPTRPALAPKEWRADDYDERGQRSAMSPNRDPERHIMLGGGILGYWPTCECRGVARGVDPLTGSDTGKTLPVPKAVFRPAPCRVLDPFAGIGTTLQTALWMKRDSVGIELNPEYAAIAEKLIEEPPRWWKRKHNSKPSKPDCPGQLRLF